MLLLKDIVNTTTNYDIEADMKVGIHLQDDMKLCKFTKKMHEILEYNGIDTILLRVGDSDFWEKIESVDFFIYRFAHSDYDSQIAKSIFPIIERIKGKCCFPTWSDYWHYDDKIKNQYLLEQKNYPVVKADIFWNRSRALSWARSTSYPKVFKLKSGAGSLNVSLVKNKKIAKNLINKMFMSGIEDKGIPNISMSSWGLFKDYMRLYAANIINSFRSKASVYSNWNIHKDYAYFQDFLPNNKYDTRITVIGGRAFGFRRLVRKNDFRASGSGNMSTDKESIDLDCVKLALKISKEMAFTSMAYDFIYNQCGEPMICEISYTYTDVAVYECPGFWDENLLWHAGNTWPQYWILCDLLRVKLKNPFDSVVVTPECETIV